MSNITSSCKYSPENWNFNIIYEFPFKRNNNGPKEDMLEQALEWKSLSKSRFGPEENKERRNRKRI